MYKHPDSFLEPKALGTQFSPFRPAFAFPGHDIDNFHTLPGSSAKGGSRVNLDDIFGSPIKGKLRCANALKLYEIAHVVERDILELEAFARLIIQSRHHSLGHSFIGKPSIDGFRLLCP
jgi:hypothetical protein